MILLQDPLLAAAQGMFQGVVQLADQLAMLAAQLERVAVQGQVGLGRMLDQGMRLAAVEVQAVDPDNSCRTIGKVASRLPRSICTNNNSSNWLRS